MRYSLLPTVTFLIASLLIGVFYTFPAYNSLSSKKEEVNLKSKELSNLKEYISHLHELEEKLEENSESLKKIDWALPEKISIPQIFEFIKKIATENGLTVIQLGEFTETLSKKEKKFSNLKEVSFPLSLAGTYFSLKNFISALEKNSKIFEIEEISFSYPKTEKEPFIFKLLIKTYSF